MVVLAGERIQMGIWLDFGGLKEANTMDVMIRCGGGGGV